MADTAANKIHGFSFIELRIVLRVRRRAPKNRCKHIPKRLWTWRERRNRKAERLSDAYDADRKITRGLLPQAGHATGSAQDEGRHGRSREHARELQHHHQGVGRPLCARRLDTTSQTQYCTPTRKKCEWINSIVYGKHYEYKRKGLWHVYMNGKPLKDKNGKAILYNYNAQPGTKGFDYKLNKKTKKEMICTVKHVLLIVIMAVFLQLWK